MELVRKLIRSKWTALAMSIFWVLQALEYTRGWGAFVFGFWSGLSFWQFWLMQSRTTPGP